MVRKCSIAATRTLEKQTKQRGFIGAATCKKPASTSVIISSNFLFYLDPQPFVQVWTAFCLTTQHHGEHHQWHWRSPRSSICSHLPLLCTQEGKSQDVGAPHVGPHSLRHGRLGLPLSPP